MSAPSKRVLLLAPYFLPRRRVGAMRPFRFAIHLRAFGWQPTVLAIAAEGQALTAKEARLLDGIDVRRLHPPFDRSTTSESQLGVAESGQSASLFARFQKRLHPLLDAVDQQFPVDTWLPFFLLKYRRLAGVVREVRPHVLWCTGDPWSGLLVAQHLAQRFEVPSVADFRDPWTLSPVRHQGVWAPVKALDRWCERRILHSADAVVFAAAQTEAAYRRRYPGLQSRTRTIYNSYDPAVFDDPVADGRAVPPTGPDEHLNIGFFGRFRELSPATPVTDVLAALRRERGAAAARDVRVHSFGPLNVADARYAEARGVRENFHRQEAVPLEEALSALRQFDVLLVSTDPQRDEIVPAKLLEYLAAGRPVLSLSKNPEVARILERTGTGVQLAPEAPGKAADLLARCLAAKRAGQPLPLPFDPQPGEVRRFAARPTTKELAALFDRVAATRAP